MQIIVVDDEWLLMRRMEVCVKKVAPDAEVIGFQYSAQAWEYAKEHTVDVAFVDISMPGMDGLELGKKLLEIQPELNLIYCTAYDEHISTAFREIRCNGYIVKPVSEEAIAEEMKHLRMPIHTEKKEKKRIRFQCFGRFEVYLDGHPMVFESARTKEMLAYLVNGCGGICPNQEIEAVLWDDDDRHDSYFKKLRKDLLDTLEKVGCEDIIWRQRGGIGINPEKVDCDYYEWKKMNSGKYTDDFMTQYEWANVPLYEW